MKEISVKEHPELRHVLAHMYYATEALLQGNQAEALYELRSIQGLIFWDEDEDLTKLAERMYEMKNCKGKKKDCKKKNCKKKSK